MATRSKSLKVSGNALGLFYQAKAMKIRIEGLIMSDVPYMHLLEDGTKYMDPRPVIKPYEYLYRRMVNKRIAEARLKWPADFRKAVIEGISEGCKDVLLKMQELTAMPKGPYYTGRARGSWIGYLPNGQVYQPGPVITADEQSRIITARKLSWRRNAYVAKHNALRQAKLDSTKAATKGPKPLNPKLLAMAEQHIQQRGAAAVQKDLRSPDLKVFDKKASKMYAKPESTQETKAIQIYNQRRATAEERAAQAVADEKARGGKLIKDNGPLPKPPKGHTTH